MDSPSWLEGEALGEGVLYPEAPALSPAPRFLLCLFLASKGLLSPWENILEHTGRGEISEGMAWEAGLLP